MDKRKLHDDITRIVAAKLYAMRADNLLKIKNLDDDSIKKYLSDGTFHMEVRSFVAHIMLAVEAENENK